MPSAKRDTMQNELFYVADPMCSWCWGFASILETVRAETAGTASLRYVMGGLAPDSDDPMPDATRAMVKNAWVQVERTTGATFNHDFWERNAPRRSTYPSCRAVLSAERLEAGSTPRMFAAIQRAYYVEARNPSDLDVLVVAARSIGMDEGPFREAMESEAVEGDLRRDLALKSTLGATGFPSLIARSGSKTHAISLGWSPWSEIETGLKDVGVLLR